MKRVLHLIKKYKGNYPLFNEYVKALPSDRYESVVCYLGGGNDGKNRIDGIAEKTIYLEMDPSWLKRLGPRSVLAVADLMKNERINIVHSHRHRATVIAALAAFLCPGTVVISHVHGLSRTRSRKRLLTNRILFRKISRIICVSDSVRHDVTGSNFFVDPEKVVTIRNGIDLALIDAATTGKSEARQRLGLADDVTVFGTIGRLSRTKGQSYLIAAFAEIRRQHREAKLVIVGEGDLADSLRDQASHLGILEDVVFTGYRDDAKALLRAFDIFVLPSVAEGLSIALLEAMASRLPVIASRVGGIPEVFGASKCGILVPDKDVPSLAGAMNQMFDIGPGGRMQMGSTARARVEEAFTADIMHKELRKVYESLG